MPERLLREEEQFVRDLLSWDAQRRPVEWALANVALIFGGILMVSTFIFTLRHLTDSWILLATVPGLLLGLLLVGFYVLLGRRVKERHRLAGILRKLVAE